MKFILNPQYILRHEGNKTYILGEPNYSKKNVMCAIHPIFAMMLSFFNGRELDEIISDISHFFQLSMDNVRKYIMPIICNEEYITNGSSVFPRNTIVEYDEYMSKHTYTPNQFVYKDVDVSISRMLAPIDIICNVSMKCRTSCIYCYADRAGKAEKTIPITLLEKIIEEAKNIGVLRFQLMGGEVLLYKDWKRALLKLSECGFHPWISTKLPIKKDYILFMKDFHFMSPIQISLDTLIKDHMYKILKVSDPYYDELIKTFELLEECGQEYIVHTVINKYNDSLDDVRSLISFFRGKKYLRQWVFDAAKCSMYIGGSYDSYKASTQSILQIQEYLNDINSQKILCVDIQPPSVLVNLNSYSKEKKKQLFDNRNLCSGNLNALYILPDGKVTICEELYWHPRFLLGDLNNQSIMEIWNSQKAKDLFFLNQESLQTSSPCRTCNDFKECRKFRHVCWRDTILAYGPEKWDYPGIMCPKAPNIEKDIFM